MHDRYDVVVVIVVVVDDIILEHKWSCFEINLTSISGMN